MKLYVNEKLFSLHDKFFVKDESGNDVYEVSSKFFSIGAKMTINDMAGNKVAYIEEEILHLMPHYNIFINDQLVCHISKKLKFFKNDYELDNGYRVDGSLFNLDFVIYDENGNQIGSIKRAFFSISDKYEVEVIDPSKAIIVLSIVVAITKDVNRSQQSSTFASSNGSD